MKNATLFSAGWKGNDPFGRFKNVEAIFDPDQLHTGGVLILWGGEDISPSLYGQTVVKARAPANPSKRDAQEVALFKAAVKLGIPIIGVCRGAQLACALSGGTLYQHIAGGHHSDHPIMTYKDQVVWTSSCHHQALNLKNVEHDLLAWDKDRMVTAYTDTASEDVIIPEVAVLRATNTFAIQGHPEWMNPLDPFVQWCSNEIQERFF